MLGGSAPVRAASLSPKAAAAFDRYVTLTEQRLDRELAQRNGTFLWIDTLSSARQAEMRRGLQDGGIVIERMETRDGSRSIDAPGALIHHWVGIVFVRGATLARAVGLMQDYNRHASVFGPNIAAAKTLEHHGKRYKVFLRFHVKKVISVTMNTENDAEFFTPSADRAYSRIRSTRIAEVENAGEAGEQEKAAGTENGFMWRLNTYWRFLERDGGTYIQCESLTLSRDVPFALGWIIRPFVTQLPKESLTFTLERARTALEASVSR